MAGRERLMKLRFREKVVGVIRDTGPDDFCYCGRIVLNREGAKLKDFFRWITDESNPMAEDPPFPEEFLDDDNWDIQHGVVIWPIFLPAVHADGSVYWKDR